MIVGERMWAMWGYRFERGAVTTGPGEAPQPAVIIHVQEGQEALKLIIPEADFGEFVRQAQVELEKGVTTLQVAPADALRHLPPIQPVGPLRRANGS